MVFTEDFRNIYYEQNTSEMSTITPSREVREEIQEKTLEEIMETVEILLENWGVINRFGFAPESIMVLDDGVNYIIRDGVNGIEVRYNSRERRITRLRLGFEYL